MINMIWSTHEKKHESACDPTDSSVNRQTALSPLLQENLRLKDPSEQVVQTEPGLTLNESQTQDGAHLEALTELFVVNNPT